MKIDEIQDRYDELDNIVSSIDILIDEITDKNYIEQLELIKYEAQNELDEVSEKSVNMLTEVHTRYRIQNIDDVNDFIEAESNGTGVDTQDKGVGKAMTYAYKYMLLRTFAIPTGEDPDKISSAEIDSKVEKELKEEKDLVINKTMEDALREVIKNNHVPTNRVLEILDDYGYEKLAEINIKDLKSIQEKLEEKQ